MQGPASRGSESNKVCQDPPTDWMASPQPAELPPARRGTAAWDLALPALELPGSRCRCHGLGALRHVGATPGTCPRRAGGRAAEAQPLLAHREAQGLVHAVEREALSRRAARARPPLETPPPQLSAPPRAPQRYPRDAGGQGRAGRGRRRPTAASAFPPPGRRRGLRRAQARARLLSSLGVAAIPGAGAAVPPRRGPASPSRKLGARGLGGGMWSHRGPWGRLHASLLAADPLAEARRGSSWGCVPGASGFASRADGASLSACEGPRPGERLRLPGDAVARPLSWSCAGSLPGTPPGPGG